MTVWEWKGDAPQGKQRHWVTFDVATSSLIEAAFGRKEGTVTLVLDRVKNGNKESAGYVIDFKSMKQINEKTGFKRDVRRRETRELFTLKIGRKSAADLGKHDLEDDIVEVVLEEEEREECPICIGEMTVMDSVAAPSQCPGHHFHKSCLEKWFTVRGSCPVCKKMGFGGVQGNMPEGSMSARVVTDMPLEGYPTTLKTIQIRYKFPDATQGDDHPHPGDTYKGTTRIAYLPDNDEGRRVLSLLRVAFEKRLTFTVGLSATIGGSDDRVTWTSVHHKTSTTGGVAKFGYPDPTYTQRVTEELKALGVLEEE